MKNPKVLFDTISDIVTPLLPVAPFFSTEDCNFFSFFSGRWNQSYKNTFFPSGSSVAVPPPAQPVITKSFSPIFLPDLKKINKSIFLFYLHSTCIFVQECLSTYQFLCTLKSLCILRMLSFTHVFFFLIQARPIYHQLLQPISKLTFLSKILEKVVAKQITVQLS